NPTPTAPAYSQFFVNAVNMTIGGTQSVPLIQRPSGKVTIIDTDNTVGTVLSLGDITDFGPPLGITNTATFQVPVFFNQPPPGAVSVRFTVTGAGVAAIPSPVTFTGNGPFFIPVTVTGTATPSGNRLFTVTLTPGSQSAGVSLANNVATGTI